MKEGFFAESAIVNIYRTSIMVDSKGGSEMSQPIRLPDSGARRSDANPELQGSNTMHDAPQSIPLPLPDLPFTVDLSPSPEQLRHLGEQNSKLTNSSSMDFEIVHGIDGSAPQADGHPHN